MKYQLCKHCDHFVVENDAAPTTLELIGDGVAAFVHLTDDDHPWIANHDAEPRGPGKPLFKWRSERPDLFFHHPDGHIGPNSVLHHHTGDAR